MPEKDATRREFLTDEEEQGVREAQARQSGAGEADAAHLVLGRRGEKLACRLLWRRGFRIVARNVHAGRGEIDIVAERAGRVHFVEVKTRSSGGMGRPEERVDAAKRQRLKTAAAAYLDEFGAQPPDGSQFDVVSLVVGPGGRVVEEELLENAF